MKRRNGRKKLQGAEGAHLLEPQKAHPTSEFTIVAEIVTI